MPPDVTYWIRWYVLLTCTPLDRRSVTVVMMSVEPYQKKVATIADPRCGLPEPNPFANVRPLIPRAPLWAGPSAATSKRGTTGPRRSGPELRASVQPAASRAAARILGKPARRGIIAVLVAEKRPGAYTVPHAHTPTVKTFVSDPEAPRLSVTVTRMV